MDVAAGRYPATRVGVCLSDTVVRHSLRRCGGRARPVSATLVDCTGVRRGGRDRAGQTDGGWKSPQWSVTSRTRRSCSRPGHGDFEAAFEFWRMGRCRAWLRVTAAIRPDDRPAAKAATPSAHHLPATR